MIRKILVPTDFSENAQLAVDYAITVANEFEIELHVLHSYTAPNSPGHFISIDKYVADERKEELSDYMDTLRPRLRETVKLKGHLFGGSAVSAICETAEEIKADLIIMGTQGATGLKKAFLGSVASNVLRNTKVPVLAIPYNLKHFAIHTLTIALDNQPLPEPFVLHPALSLGRQFNGKFNLLHLQHDTEDSNIDESVTKLFTQFDIPYECIKLKADDLEGGILNVAHKYKTNLLCLVTRERNWLDRLFFGSVSQDLIMQSDLPILVMHSEI